MSDENLITLKKAKQQFFTIIHSISDKDKKCFIEFILEQLSDGEKDEESFDGEFGMIRKTCHPNQFEKTKEQLDDPVAILNIIAEDIKKRLPLKAILPSEEICTPKIGDNADCLAGITEHLDEFLYDENDVEDLVDDGKLHRNYCKDCGSKNVEPLIFISHSTSRDTLFYIFNNCLPTLENKTVLDIGSRLGAVLYGAYVFTDAPHIIGVEMNEDFCKLQNDIIREYKMTDRVKVLHQKIEESKEVVKSADVIIFNNSFEFYLTEEKQVQIWQFLRHYIRSGTILVTRPHLETIFKNLDTGIDLNEWVKPYKFNESSFEDDDDNDEDDEHVLHNFATYKVL